MKDADGGEGYGTFILFGEAGKMGDALQAGRASGGPELDDVDVPLL